MRMTADQRETHVPFHTERIVNHPACFHRHRRAHGAKPIDIILNHKQSPRRHQRREKMMVGGNGSYRANVGIEPRGEPSVFSDDLLGSLDVFPFCLFGIGNPPGRGPAGPGFLRDSQGDAFLKRADHERALAVAAASRNTEPFWVDSGFRRAELFEPVNDAADTPCPGERRAGTVGFPVQVEKPAGAVAGRVGLRGTGVVAKGDTTNSARDGDASAADTDDGGSAGATATGGFGDADGDGFGVGPDFNGETHAAAGHGGRDGIRGWWKVAELELLEDLAHFGLATGKVLGGRDGFTAGEFPGIREGGFRDGAVSRGCVACCTRLSWSDNTRPGGNGSGGQDGQHQG